MTVMLCLSCSLWLLNRRPRTHSAGCWLSLLHLISIFSGPQIPSVGCGFPYHISSPTVWNSTGNSTRTRTQLSYIMVQRPLDLWNRMLDRHQAEITVMQFTGHQSMSVPWEFFSSSHFISQFPLLTAIGMCHFFHLEWHFGPGQKVKI